MIPKLIAGGGWSSRVSNNRLLGLKSIIEIISQSYQRPTVVSDMEAKPWQTSKFLIKEDLKVVFK